FRRPPVGAAVPRAGAPPCTGSGATPALSTIGARSPGREPVGRASGVLVRGERRGTGVLAPWPLPGRPGSPSPIAKGPVSGGALRFIVPEASQARRDGGAFRPGIRISAEYRSLLAKRA